MVRNGAFSHKQDQGDLCRSPGFYFEEVGGFFCPERLGDFFCPQSSGDFIFVLRGWVIFF